MTISDLEHIFVGLKVVGVVPLAAQAALKAIDKAGFQPPRPKPVKVEIVRQR